MKNKNTELSKEIYFLTDYNWEKGTLIKECRKNYKIWDSSPGFKPSVRFVAKDKCAFPDEKICVVWEMWKGVNGRGAYRVEKEGYPHKRIPAKKVSRQHSIDRKGRVTEEVEGGNTPQPEIDYEPEKMQDALLTVEGMVADPYDHDYYNLAEATKDLIEQAQKSDVAFETTKKSYQDLLDKYQTAETTISNLENENEALQLVQIFADALMHAVLKNASCLPDICRDELLELTNSLEHVKETVKSNE